MERQNLENQQKNKKKKKTLKFEFVLCILTTNHFRPFNKLQLSLAEGQSVTQEFWLEVAKR